MTPKTRKKAVAPAARKADAEMKKYGIVRVPVDYFHFGPFRYANLEDAISYAKRKHGSE